MSDVRPVFFQLMWEGRFNEAHSLMKESSIPEKDAYLFLVDEIFERFDTPIEISPDLSQNSRFALECAELRRIYRGTDGFETIAHKAKKLLSQTNLDDNDKYLQFWYSHLIITIAFCYHSIGNFSKAKEYYERTLGWAKHNQWNFNYLDIVLSLMELALESDFESYPSYRQIFISLIEQHSINFLYEGIFYATDAEWEYVRGKYPNALNALEKAKDLLSPIRESTYLVNVYVRLGRINRDLGNFNDLLKHFGMAVKTVENIQGKNLVKTFLYRNVGIAQSVLGNHDQAFKALEKALDFANDVSNPIELAKVYFNFIEVAFSAKRPEIIKKYLDALTVIHETASSRYVSQFISLGKVFHYLSIPRAESLVKAQRILRKVKTDDDLQFRLKVYANYLYLQTLFIELSFYFNEAVLDEINQTFQFLVKLTESYPSRILRLQISLLKARFLIILNDVSAAMKEIEHAEKLAKEWNVEKLTEMVEEEKTHVVQKAKAYELFLKTFDNTDLGEQLRNSEVYDYLNLVKTIIQSIN